MIETPKLTEVFEHSSFELVSDFGFRVSSLIGEPDPVSAGGP
jgi:hypothetical protein